MMRSLAVVAGAVSLTAIALATLSSGCSGADSSASSPDVDGSSDAGSDAQRPTDDGATPSTPTDAGVVALSSCPTSGIGAVDAPSAMCGTVLPPATGADPAGVNADAAHYVLRPTAGDDGVLVVFLNGSGGDPAHILYNATKNVYTAALAAGHKVIGLSYRSNQAIGQLCVARDGCFLPTRMTLLTGLFQTGASNTLTTILPSEGIEDRLRLLLTYLSKADPSGNWGSLLTSDGTDMMWSKIIASGYSQGGGHATLIGKVHAVVRVVALSSPCDSIGNAPPLAASWEHADSSWATSPASSFYALSAATIFDGGAPVGGDTGCPAHADVWNALGASAANTHDDAIICPAVKDGHGATVGCIQNFDAISALYKLP